MSANEATVDRKIDLLLVDDRLDNLLTLEAVLSSSEYNLIKARSGDEALRYLLTHEPAVILMDVQMPNLDGFETAALIKRSERTRQIPIIFITAINKDEEFVHRGYDQGAVDYLYKPYDAHILRSKVAVFAELARKTRQLVEAEKQIRENERKERERQLVQLELKNLRREQTDQKRYRDLVEGIGHGIVWSAELEPLRITFVSPSAEKILGFPPEQWSVEEDFLGKHLPDGDREKLLESIQIARSENRDVGLEHRFISSSDRELWFHTGFRIAKLEDSDKFELRGLSVDITKIKEAEEILRENKKRSDFMAEASLLLSESLNSETSLHDVARLSIPHLADWFSIDVLDDSDSLKTLAFEHVDPKMGDTYHEVWRKLLSSTKNSTAFSRVLSTKKSELYENISDDKLIQITPLEKETAELEKLSLNSLMIVPLVARGKILGLLSLGTTRDERLLGEVDLKSAEDLARRVASSIDSSCLYQEVQAAVRTRDEFLSIASHELKTPLTPLKLQTQALMRMLGTGALSEIKPEKVNKMLQTSDRQLGRLSRLVDDLLDISRLNNGKFTLTYEDFDFVELVQDVLSRFAGQLSLAQCTVELEAESSISVHWDKFRIEQVFINLLTNAMKYGQNKPIHISVSQVGEQVRFSLRDHGIGISKVDHERIFHRFERAVSGNHFGGLGLGLYIVTQILSAHGGKITVDSQLGEGSVFTVVIPAHSEESMPGLSTAGGSGLGIQTAL